jgi:hypothetical protein
MTTKIRTTGPMITGRVVLLNAVKDPKDENLSFRWSVGEVIVSGILRIKTTLGLENNFWA